MAHRPLINPLSYDTHTHTQTHTRLHLRKQHPPHPHSKHSVLHKHKKSSSVSPARMRVRTRVKCWSDCSGISQSFLTYSQAIFKRKVHPKRKILPLFQPRQIEKMCLLQHWVVLRCMFRDIWNIQWVVLKTCSVLSKTHEHESGNILLFCLLHVSWQLGTVMSGRLMVCRIYWSNLFQIFVLFNRDSCSWDLQCCTRWATEQFYYGKKVIHT